MDEQILSEYAALTDVPCDSPLRKIDPDDMFTLMFLLLLFSWDPEDRNPDSVRERVRELIEKATEEGGEDNNVQPTNDRT